MSKVNHHANYSHHKVSHKHNIEKIPEPKKYINAANVQYLLDPTKVEIKKNDKGRNTLFANGDNGNIVVINLVDGSSLERISEAERLVPLVVDSNSSALAMAGLYPISDFFKRPNINNLSRDEKIYLAQLVMNVVARKDVDGLGSACVQTLNYCKDPRRAAVIQDALDCYADRYKNNTPILLAKL